MRGIPRQFVWLPAALAVLCHTAAFGATAKVVLRIPSQRLDDALIEFAEQAQLSVSESGIDFGAMRSNPVVGTFSPAEALARMLQGTGFSADFIDPQTIVVRRARPPDKSGPPAVPAAESVIVSATKRVAAAQSLPYTISVVPESRLDAYRLQSLQDLTSQVPGLTATNLGPSENKLFLRGLTDSVLPGLSQTVVGIYLDDAKLADDAPDPDLQLVDVDRVEVLQGPQGSLYGAGALTGLIRIVTRKPVTDAFEEEVRAGISATQDGSVGESVAAMINIPLVENELAARAVGYSDQLGGYVDSIALRTDNANRTGIDGGRFAIEWIPGADWSVLANVAGQHTASDDSQYYIQELGAYNRDNLVPEPHSDNILLAGVTISGALGWANLLSTANFLDRGYHTQFDASPAWPGLTGLSPGPAPFDFGRGIRSFMEETRLVSTSGGSWQWLAGILVSHSDEDFLSTLRGPGPAGDVIARVETREDRMNEAALYGEASYRMTEQISATAGVRLFASDHITSAADSGTLVGTPASIGGSTRQMGVAPKFVVDYEPSSATTLYALYSEGYRLGGITVDSSSGEILNSPTRFAPDELHNYEVGAKIGMLDNRMQLNVAAFFEDWRSAQSDAVAPDGAFYIVNVGRVQDPGAEFELEFEPTDGLTLNANAFWNNTAVSRTSPIASGGETGLPGAPPVSAALTIDYRRPLGAQLSMFAGLQEAYVGGTNLGFTENTPTMGNYNLINLWAALETGSLTVRVFADNIANNQSNTFAFGNPFDSQGQITPPRPRTVGLMAEWRQ